VHFIGHSAGAKLIHDAATAYISDYFLRQRNTFFHLTFLDAYTPSDWDTDSYGSLPVDYPNHHAEHYVDRGVAFTDACLANAFNFDITGWTNADKSGFLGPHQWPHRWYKQSVTFTAGTDTLQKPGFKLSFEGGNDQFGQLDEHYRPGEQCPLSDEGTSCIPAACWP
jgi:hypothetical protein